MSPRQTRLLLLCALSACGKPTLVASEGEVDVSPRELDLGRVLIGGQRTAQLTLTNRSKARRQVTLSASPPFAAPDELWLEGAQSLPLDVSFRPEGAGPAAGVLGVTPEGEPLEVALRGEGVEAPVCTAPEAPCREARVDPETLGCVEVPGADGTACSTPCTPSGTCASGSCVGPAAACDDGDACTLDLCSSEAGCQHVDGSQQCPAPTDPCQAARCDPREGCRSVDVADGTPCGANDCTTSHVCLGGRCLARSTPGGAACGDSSPCQARGACQGQVCVQPAPSKLMPVWTHPRGTFSSVTFPGVGDAAGNVFWFEQGAQTSLVSVDRNGAPRFKAMIGDLPTATAGAVALIGGDVLVLVFTKYQGGSGRLEARSASTGALLWARGLPELRDALRVSPGNQGFWMMSVAEGRGGDVVANIRSNNGGAAWFTWFVAFDRHTGLLRWSRPYDYVNELLTDEAGNVYGYVELWEHRLFSIDPAGSERWNLLVGSSQMPGAAPPLLAYGQTVLVGPEATLRSTANGAVLPAPNLAGQYASTYGSLRPLMTRNVMMTPASTTLCVSGMQGTALSGPAGAWAWTSSTECLSDVTLTSAGALLVIYTRTPGTVRVRELDDRGTERFTCAVDATSAGGLSVLHDGRLVLFDRTTGEVKAFDLPGVRVAAKGWVGLNGGPARNKRQR